MYSEKLTLWFHLGSALIISVSLASQIVSSGEGNGTPFQCSCLENPMDRGAWWAAVHGVARSRTRLSDFPFTFHFNSLKKEMSTHSSVLAWRIPGTGEPGGLPSMGSHRIRRDWSDLAAAAAAAVIYTLTFCFQSQWSSPLHHTFQMKIWITCSMECTGTIKKAKTALCVLIPNGFQKYC